MGRTLDALRRAENGPSESNPSSALIPPLRVASEEEPLLVETEEVPFIEVGPRKSMEASPSVLACAPSRSLGAQPQLQMPVVELPRRDVRSVQFRPLPGRNERHSALAPELVAFHAPDEPAAQQFRDVLDAILRTSPTHDRPAVLLFSAAQPRCGTTMTLLNLALTAVSPQRQVLVVDANLREPGIAAALGLPAVPGLREVLAGTVSLEEVIQPTEQVNLFALTAGGKDSAGVRFVVSPLRSLLRQLRQRYPLIFVDGPWCDGQPDGVTLGTACDAVFLVVPEQEAETPQTDALLQRLTSQGVRLAGCVLVADSSTSHGPLRTPERRA